jgi:peptidoglycan/LPS O-acetylase OafA/YrhL
MLHTPKQVPSSMFSPCRLANPLFPVRLASFQKSRTKSLSLAFDLPENNFTLLRLIAAISVLYYHCYPLALGRGAHDPITTLMQKYAGIGLGGLAVGSFFLISGFLVTASFVNRQNLLAFVEARALRIFPGLLVAVLFCVLIVGPLSTSLPLVDYLSNNRSWSFLAKNSTLIFGIQYDLPGVF